MSRWRRRLRALFRARALDGEVEEETRLHIELEAQSLSHVHGLTPEAAQRAAAIRFGGVEQHKEAHRDVRGVVRMALGARASEVIGMFVWRGMGHAITGAALGLVLAFWVTRALATALFDVSATDPATLAAVTTLLLAAALAACWLPARRAAAIQPVTALRLD